MEALESIQRILQMIRIGDVVDVAIMSYVIYRCMKLLKDSSAMRLAKGILIIFIIQQVASICNLNTIQFVLNNAFASGTIVERKESAGWAS